MMGMVEWMKARMLRAMLAVAVMGGLVLGVGAAARAEENQFARDFGMGLGAAGANLVYMPVKVVYATLGGITGSFAYGLTGGNIETARKVWTPSMGGTYVVTPDMLRQKERVMFSGTTEPMRTEVASSAGAPLAPPRTESAAPVVTEEAANRPFEGY